ncbi:hypothetical protein LCGC14_0740130 [marine sediment metagenome]|uniref:Uncharacterized protein n=1 Tax=marine sediment metagenome TaxID=412755 RepID=A0A0F9TEA4_9ZZZZ
MTDIKSTMKLWHSDWDEFVLSVENPGGFALVENETEVDVFLTIMATKETAEAEVERVNNLWIDDVVSDVHQCDDFWFVVTVDWCGSSGLIKDLYN